MYLVKLDFDTLINLGTNKIIFTITAKGYSVVINDVDMRQYASTSDGLVFKSKLGQGKINTVYLTLKGTLVSFKIYPPK